MRVLIAIAIIMFGVGAAGAADYAVGRGGHGYFVAHYAPTGEPAGQLYTYDWEPGVVVRAYWLPPWRGHHYFPFGRDRWDIRRVRSHPVRPKPAQSYYRYWSTSSGFVDESPPPRYWPDEPVPAPRPPVFEK
jgi:hypothetical protein